MVLKSQTLLKLIKILTIFLWILGHQWPTLGFTWFPNLFERAPENRQFTCNKIGPSEILSVISILETKMAKGFYSISAHTIRENYLTLVPVLVELLNQTVRTSVFPERLNIARFEPLFKKVCKSSMSNYCVILILSIISKIFEILESIIFSIYSMILFRHKSSG